MKKILAVLFFTITAPLIALAYASPGNPTGFVNDFANVLTAEQKTTLEQTLVQNEKSTGNEISVAVVSSLGGDTVENYAEKLFKEWGIGKEKQDNGALLLVAIEDRKMRIEVGYGLEPVLTDAISSWIIRDNLTPKFKEGKYYEGITAGVEKMIAATKGEVTVPASENGGQWWNDPQIFFFLFWLVIVFAQAILSMLARSRSWWMGGVFGGVAGVLTMIFATLAIGIIITAFLVPLGLILDYFISKEYAKSGQLGRKPRWWAGGPWIGGGFGGGNSSGGGFGGFGGGSSGGGGASGSW